MSRDEIRAAVLSALAAVAPEVDPATLDPCESLRDQVDLDSMDFLTFVTRIDQSVGVTVPEADYAMLSTLDGCIDYLASALAGSAGSGTA